MPYSFIHCYHDRLLFSQVWHHSVMTNSFLYCHHNRLFFSLVRHDPAAFSSSVGQSGGCNNATFPRGWYLDEVWGWLGLSHLVANLGCKCGRSIILRVQSRVSACLSTTTHLWIRHKNMSFINEPSNMKWEAVVRQSMCTWPYSTSAADLVRT